MGIVSIHVDVNGCGMFKNKPECNLVTVSGMQMMVPGNMWMRLLSGTDEQNADRDVR